VREKVAIVARRSRLDLLLAIGLTLVGELEVVLSSSGGDGRLVRALALPVATLPLAWRRDLPLLPPAAVAASLLLQIWLGDFFDAAPVTPLVAIVLAVYGAGRYVTGGRALAGAVVLLAVIAATRIAFDPAVDDPGVALMTAVAVVLPFLIGRWVRGQARLQRELEQKALRRERERERAARDAAEEERMRIALDLQAAVADRLAEVVRQAGALPDQLAAGAHEPARGLLASIADSARESLADVRRVLGILRRDGSAPLAPSAPVSHDAWPAPPTPESSAAATHAGPLAAASDPESSAAATDAGPLAAATDPESSAAATDAGSPVGLTAAESSAVAAPRPSWLPARVDARLLDRALVAALLIGAEIELAIRVTGSDQLFAALSAVAIVAPLLWRRHHPVPVALAVLGAVAIQSAVLDLDSFPASDIAALMCAAYAIGAYAERRHAVAGLALFAVGEAVHAAVFNPGAVAIALLGAAAVPWTVGRIVRAQRQLMHETREKAAQIERTREREARAAVTAERMRVARELHDAVAHNLSVIAIQAAGADGIVERDPVRATQCANLIETVATETIAELSRLAGLPAGGREGAPPSLARVDALAQRARESGLPVELRVEGEPGRLAAGVDLAAFRIVQEALANVSKHAGAARAWVVVRYEQRAVEVEIGDDGRGANGSAATSRARSATGGHGLIGMRERAALYGGTLDAGNRPGGGFAVRARLPLGGA
jgi:signal transduction histidine kinase